MSPNTADPIQSNGHKADASIAAKFDSFMNVVSDTFEDLGATEDQLKEIKDRGKELGEEIDTQVSDNSDSIKDNAADIDQERERRSAEVEGCHNRINRVSDDIEAVEDDSDDDHPTPSKGETSPLERICRLSESNASQLTNNQRRARFIAKDISDYSRKLVNGKRGIKSSEIRKVLSAAENATIYTQTVSRVMDFASDLGKSHVSIKETQSGERTLVFDEEIIERLNEIPDGVAQREGKAVISPTI